MIDVTYVNPWAATYRSQCSRVSFGKKSHYEMGQLAEKDRKLIHYLARHKHTSPFGHVFASFHVRAPVFVARQLVKTSSYVGMRSAAAMWMNPEFYEPEFGVDVVLTKSRVVLVK